MWAMTEYQSFSFASSAASTAFSHAVRTSSSCLTAAVHCLASKLKVSSLFPLYFGGGSPLNFASSSEFQKIKWLTNCPTEWFPLPSFQLACSAVSPSTATLAGTNHSFWLWVVRSCSSRTLLSVGTGFWSSANASSGNTSSDGRILSLIIGSSFSDVLGSISHAAQRLFPHAALPNSGYNTPEE